MDYVKVSYFHTSYRCVNCTNFEKWTQEVISEQFQKKISNKRIVFESINIEEEVNKKYIQQYQLVTKSIVLSKIVDKNELKWKNLDKIWMKVRNETKFKDYIVLEIRMMMRGKTE